MGRIHQIYSLIFKVWRKKRFELFRNVMLGGGRVTAVLDVGGYPGFWASQEPVAARIDCLNIHEVEWNQPAEAVQKIQTMLGDGCAMPEFADGGYELAFSNSVIEHVGSWENQERFAKEIRRVGRRVWVQTPAYECPIEPHYIAPFIHYLPKSWQMRLIPWITVWGWVERPTAAQVREAVETTRLLTRAEMNRLFPDCEIITERLLGILPKSYIAVRKA